MNTEEELKKLGIKPVEAQNFLISERTIEKLVEEAEVEDKNVLEIGPGTGNITKKLEKANKVLAVEKDTKLAKNLEKIEQQNLEVLNKDFNQLNLENYKIDIVVGNIPFNITKQILEKIGKAQLPAVLIIQEDVADKIVAEPGDSNYTNYTVKNNYYYIPIKLNRIPSSYFYPKPEVNAALVKLIPNKDRHNVKDEAELLKMSNALFTHKRKKTRNAYTDARHILEISKDKAKEIRDKLPNSEKRVNQLEVVDIKEITEKHLELTNKNKEN